LAAIRRRPQIEDNAPLVGGGGWRSTAPDATLDLELASGPGIAPVTGPPASSGIALLEAAVRARETERDAAQIQVSSEPPGRSTAMPNAAVAGPSSSVGPVQASAGGEGPTRTEPGSVGGLATSGPCAEKRRATDELCALAN